MNATMTFHPHDPNAPEMAEELAQAETVLEEIRACCALAEQASKAGRIMDFMAAMQSAKSYLECCDFDAVRPIRSNRKVFLSA